MRRLLLLVAPLALVAAGCGGGGGAAKGPSHSVLEVSKAFYDAGLPFTGIVTGNPYVTGQTPFLPAQLNKSDVRFDVLAELSGTNTSDHTGEVVWVFDTDAHASEALKQVPLKDWGQGPQEITREQLGNVVVIASGFKGAPKAKLDKALSALR
ncbi:MAG: hypothetical protein E6F98_11705 [Actinobacteria bacterium]|nr:MAG: hypothetical protein E6F98_11705 [Actinomycetota bacterium]